MRDPIGSVARADVEAGGEAAGDSAVGSAVAITPPGMPDPQFHELLARFRRDTRTASQLALARELARGGVVLTCTQIAAIMQTSAIDSTRVQVGATLWPRASDPAGFGLLTQALEHEGSRTLLRQQTGH